MRHPVMTVALAGVFSLSIGAAATTPAQADAHVSAETVEKIIEMLASMRCEMDPDDIEVDGDEIELDDVFCGGGQFDIDLNEEMHITGHESRMTGAPALDISGVSHAFGAVRALDNVSLKVPRGRFVALLGVNGAGKTTLFSLITRLYDNVSGTISVCGHDVRRMPGPALAELGVVFQSRALDMGLTIRQNFRYHAALHGIGANEARARGDDVLARVGLSEKADAKVATLSGGQVRRAEIARALLHKPGLLLLDEPTVGLDVRSRRDVVESVRALADSGETGVLWATHLFDEVRGTDDVVLLHKGAVLATGTADEIADGETLSARFMSLTGLDPTEIAA